MWTAIENLELKDWLIVASTLLGPVLAVQAQKWVERWRERTGRKKWIFQTLMATRNARLATDHVQALNMIELAFYGMRRKWFVGGGQPTKSEEAVLQAWRSYRTHLHTQYPQNDPAAAGVWNGTSNALFVNLLVAIAPDVGYRFEREQLGDGGYTPVGFGQLANDQNQLRQLTIELLEGRRALSVRPAPTVGQG